MDNTSCIDVSICFICCVIGSQNNGNCSILSEFDCFGINGIPFNNNCFPNQNFVCINELLTGACCFENDINIGPTNTCLITDELDCLNNYNGIYQGNGTICSTTCV